MFNNLVTFSCSSVKDRGIGIRHLQGYINRRGKLSRSVGTFYSLDDILNMIESAVQTIDSKLIELGRELSPGHRTTYLRLFQLGLNDSPMAWSLHDLGVYDKERLKALFDLEVKLSSEEVLNLNALPNDLFYEFLELYDKKVTKD